MFVKNELPQNTMLLISGLLGILTQGVGQVINYWLGSSAGSKDKTSTIAEMAGAKPVVKR